MFCIPFHRPVDRIQANKIDSESKRATLQQRHQVQAVVSMNNKIFQHSCFEPILLGGETKIRGTSKLKNSLDQECDLFDVGLVVQKARKQGGTALLQWDLIRFYN